MRRFIGLAAILGLAAGIVAVLVVHAAPAQADTPTITARANSVVSPRRVDFTVRVSRASKVRLDVYKDSTLVRTMSAPTAVTTYAPAWDIKDSRGNVLPAGTYSFRATAVSYAGPAATRGTVAVTAPAPAPAPARRWFGLYVSGVPSDMTPLLNLESKIASHAAVVNFYVADSESFPMNRATSIRDHGSIPMITWEFWSTQSGGVASLANGSKDSYLRSFADQAKSFGGTVWLRPLHEMNGNWYPWCGTVGGNSSAQVVAAYRHIHDVFVARGATNVKFAWSPNSDSVPNTTANQISVYWPGSTYVDYIALDGYNFGTSVSGSSWRSFTDVFKNSYAAVAALSSTKPIFIAETASSPSGGNKAAWISNMFAVIPRSFPRISGVVWFDTNKETDWRIEADPACIQAFKTGLRLAGIGLTIEPIEGSNRFDTAIAAAEKAFPDGAGTVIVAWGRNFPDALGASALCGSYDAPLLLTETAYLPTNVRDEITHLRVTHAVIIGSSNVVSNAVAEDLALLVGGAAHVERIAGGDRYDTASRVATRTLQTPAAGSADDVFLAVGDNFPDALAASPAAYAKKWPILLTRRTGLPSQTLAALTALKPERVHILGSTGAVPQAVEDQIKRAFPVTIDRWQGATRYATAVDIANKSGLTWTAVGVATGENFPDALAGGVMQGKLGSVVVLTPKAYLHADTRSALIAHKLQVSFVRYLGSTSALTAAVRSSVEDSLR